MIKAGPISGDRLKSFAERAERIIEERKSVSGDLKDIFAEAKGVGYDPKTLRWAIAERAMDAADRAERDALRDTYAVALGLAADAVRDGDLSLRDAGRKYGVSKSSLHRALAVPSCPEMTADDLGTAEPIREMVADDLGDPLLVIDRDRAAFRAKVQAIASSIRVPILPSSAPVAAPPDELGSAAGAGPFDAQHTESCGGVESRHAGKLGGVVPQTDSANVGKAHAPPTPTAGVAPGPQDPLDFPAHLDVRSRVLA